MTCGIICIVWPRIVSSNRKDIHSNVNGRRAANHFFTQVNKLRGQEMVYHYADVTG